jgi:hypothetical protein
VCFLIALPTLFFSPSHRIVTISQFIFSICIPLTNVDKIKIRKYKAFLLSAILTLTIYFSSFYLALRLSEKFDLDYTVIIISVVAGILILILNSFYIEIRNYKIGIATIFVLILLSAILTKIFNLSPTNAPIIFMILWQTSVGLGISLGIRLKMENKIK